MEFKDEATQPSVEPARDASQKPANGQAPSSPSPVEVGLGGDSSHVVLDVGQVLRINLPASPATGHDWVLEGGNFSILRMESDPGMTPPGFPLSGVGTMRRWEFRAERSGHAVLNFDYRRSWQYAFPILTARFSITVR